MSYPIRLAVAVVAAVASVAGGSAPDPMPAATDVQVPAVALAHAAVDDFAVDLVDVDGAATARTTQLSAQADQISKAAADLQAAKQAQAAAAAKTAAASKSAVTSTPVVVVAPGSARDIARQMMLSMYGWGDDQFTCFDKIITQESGWNVSATNRSSGAYGIPQALPGSKMATAGADWQTNPATQIKWALGYVQGRYSTACGAWSFKSAHGWY
jgi:Transglycosylase SLT domain